MGLATDLTGGRVIFGTIISQRAVEPVGRMPSAVPSRSSATAVRERGAGAMGARGNDAEASSGLEASSDIDSAAGPLTW